MEFDNLNDKHFTVAEKTANKRSSYYIRKHIYLKFVNLSAEDRKKYGSINEQNKLIVNKVKDYRASHPNLSSPDVNWIEFQADYDDRESIVQWIQRIVNIEGGLDNIKILADNDNFKAALRDYEYSKYKATTNAFGYEEKCSEIKQFFSGGSHNEPEIKE